MSVTIQEGFIVVPLSEFDAEQTQDTVELAAVLDPRQSSVVESRRGETPSPEDKDWLVTFIDDGRALARVPNRPVNSIWIRLSGKSYFAGSLANELQQPGSVDGPQTPRQRRTPLERPGGVAKASAKKAAARSSST